MAYCHRPLCRLRLFRPLSHHHPSSSSLMQLHRHPLDTISTFELTSWRQLTVLTVLGFALMAFYTYHCPTIDRILPHRLFQRCIRPRLVACERQCRGKTQKVMDVASISSELQWGISSDHMPFFRQRPRRTTLGLSSVWCRAQLRFSSFSY